MTRSTDVERFSWRDCAAAALLALAILAGAGLRMVPGVVGVIDDDGVYAVTAKALAEGDGYRLVNLPGEPPQTKYPILYPALLSLAWRAGSSLETRLFAMQCATAALGAVALAMAYLYCVRFRISSRAPAFGACLLAASAPNFLFYSSQTVTEMPFLALLVTALWTVETRLREPAYGTSDAPASRSLVARDVVAGMLLGAPLLCRSVGAVVPLVAVGLLARAGKAVRWIVVGVLVVSVPWFVWSSSGVRVGGGGDAMFGHQNDYLGWWWANGSLVVPLTNAFKLSLSFTHIDLEGIAGALYARTDAAESILFVVGSLAWLVVAARSLSLAPLPITLLAYLALVCFWPWPPDRFLIPILPFLAALSLQAMWDIAARLGAGRVGRIALTSLFLALPLSNLGVLSDYANASKDTGYPYIRLTETPVRWKSYQAAFDWLGQHSREDEVLAAGFDTMTYLYTDRPAVRPFVFRPLSIYYGAPGPPIGTAAELRENLKKHGARYLFLSPMPGYPIEEAFYELVYAAMDEEPELLKPVWQATDDLRFAIFEVSAGSSP